MFPPYSNSMSITHKINFYYNYILVNQFYLLRIFQVISSVFNL